jgi:hypothetical protein
MAPDKLRSAPSVICRKMSDKMFERITSTMTLREFNLAVSRMNEVERKNLELEYERLTGMECDDAARLQSDDQFVEAMRQAYENVKRRKQTEGKVMEIYA